MDTLPERLPAPPDVLERRLIEQGLVVRSVWFPTLAELEAWSSSGAPLYVRPMGRRRLELGPRLGSMWASVFSPVLDLEILPDGEGARLEVRRRLPRLTSGLLVVWCVLLAAWGGTMLVSPVRNGVLFWALLVLATVLAPVVGWSRGGRALDDGVPWLAVLLHSDGEEDF